MLVLSRKSGEEIVVPEFDFKFKILEVRGDYVRVGIEAPKDIKVYRREIWERISQFESATLPADSPHVGG